MARHLVEEHCLTRPQWRCDIGNCAEVFTRRRDIVQHYKYKNSHKFSTQVAREHIKDGRRFTLEFVPNKRKDAREVSDAIWSEIEENPPSLRVNCKAPKRSLSSAAKENLTPQVKRCKVNQRSVDQLDNMLAPALKPFVLLERMDERIAKAHVYIGQGDQVQRLHNSGNRRLGKGTGTEKQPVRSTSAQDGKNKSRSTKDLPTSVGHQESGHVCNETEGDEVKERRETISKPNPNNNPQPVNLDSTRQRLIEEVTAAINKSFAPTTQTVKDLTDLNTKLTALVESLQGQLAEASRRADSLKHSLDFAEAEKEEMRDKFRTAFDQDFLAWSGRMIDLDICLCDDNKSLIEPKEECSSMNTDS